MIGLLPPEDAASWLAIDAATQSPRVRPSFSADTKSPAGEDAEAVEPPVEAVFEDPRTRDQKCLDVFTDVMRKGATSPDVPRIDGAAAVVSVHADLDDIVAGRRGVGWVPGITEPLPDSAVQQLLCHADSTTTVFGEAGQVLCHFHHAVVHKTGWTLVMIGGAPHFVPLDCLDWTRAAIFRGLAAKSTHGNVNLGQRRRTTHTLPSDASRLYKNVDGRPSA